MDWFYYHGIFQDIGRHSWWLFWWLLYRGNDWISGENFNIQSFLNLWLNSELAISTLIWTLMDPVFTNNSFKLHSDDIFCSIRWTNLFLRTWCVKDFLNWVCQFNIFCFDDPLWWLLSLESVWVIFLFHLCLWCS